MHFKQKVSAAHLFVGRSNNSIALKRPMPLLSAVLTRLLMTCWLLAGSIVMGLSARAQIVIAQSALDSIRVRYDLPALAAAVIEPNRIRYVYGGVRRKYQPSADSVRLTDYFHLGSNTKGVTSLLAAKLVEAGRLSWDSRLLDVVPELRQQARPAYGRVTLGDLLSHRTGIAPYMQRSEFKRLPPFKGPDSTRRLEFARVVLQQPPVGRPPGKRYAYSNAGYVIAALMLEHAAHRSWESLLDSTFRQLGLNYWLGFPNMRATHEPWGHWGSLPLDSVLMPLGPTPDAYRWGRYMNPAVNLSMPLPDFAHLVQLHLCGLLGRTNYLRARTYREVHFGRPEYAYGWFTDHEPGSLGSRISEHDGSTGTFFCHVVIYPGRSLAIVVVANEGGLPARQACHALRRHLLQLYQQRAF